MMAPPRWASRLLGAFTALVYVFLLAPVAIVILLAFNEAEYGGLPITGFTWRWFAALGEDAAIVDALLVSLQLGGATALISGTIGAAAAYAIARLPLPGRDTIQLGLTLPVLVPHLILGVGLLLAFRATGLGKNFGLLLAGHVALTLPFVVMTTLPRFHAIPRAIEEAARSLGASRTATMFGVVLPLAWPAILGGATLAFISSFDEVTATLFWRPPNLETVPTQIMGMLQYSIDQRINALGATMTALSLAAPAAGLLLTRAFRRRIDGDTA